MTLLDWVAAAVIVGGVAFLRRQIVALLRRATAAARKRPVLWSVPLVLLGLLVAWKGPEWQLASRMASLTAREYLELQNSYRATIVQALGGIFLLLGLYLTWRRVEIAGEGQITERFTRAIEQLGSDRLEVRLGGIYALERIARDSEKDHWPIMEVLTAYVRENAPLPEEDPENEEEEDSKPVATDIQAILTVIGRRRVEFHPPDASLQLSRTNLFRANLIGAKLSLANLSLANVSLANLPLANLSYAYLIRANLSSAHLAHANLFLANLSGADLSGADLSSADLLAADLSSTDLSSAALSAANLCGANLTDAKGLTREQIESAITDETTILPDYLKEGGGESAEEAGGEGES